MGVLRAAQTPNSKLNSDKSLLCIILGNWLVSNGQFLYLVNRNNNTLSDPSVLKSLLSVCLKASLTFHPMPPLPFRAAIHNLIGTRDQFHGRQFFHRQGWGRWFQDDSLHLLCTSITIT